MRAISSKGENGQAEVNYFRSFAQHCNLRYWRNDYLDCLGTLPLSQAWSNPAGWTYQESLRQNQLVLLGAAEPVDLAFELNPNLIATND